MLLSLFGAPPAGLVLGESEVHVWRFPLKMPVEARTRMVDWLSTAERDRIERYRSSLLQARGLVSRGMLRWILSLYTGIGARDLTLQVRAFGKPELVNPGTAGRLEFNLSHSGELALVAVAWNRAVGIDLEYMRTDVHVAETAKVILTEREYATLLSLPPEFHTVGFYNAWTRKEAVVKALGFGFSLSPRRLEVSFGPGEPAVIRRMEGHAAKAWELFALDLGRNYTGALAVAGPGCKVRHFAVH